MKRTIRTTIGLAAACLAPLAFAQESSTSQDDAQKEDAKQEEESKEDEKDLEDSNPFRHRGEAAGAGSQEEMVELFIKVDKRLQRVSELLFEASTGDPSRASEIGSSGIDELIREAESGSAAGADGIARILEASRMQGEAARSEIDRILELAKQNQQQSGSPSDAPPQEGDMPQQGQTPSGSRKEEKGEGPPQPEGQGKKPQPQNGDQESNDDQDRPEGNQEKKGGEDGPGKNPPQSELGAEANASGNEEWGDLPVHLRKVFQNGVRDDVPPRYRDWVDSYYRRLNRGGGR